MSITNGPVMSLVEMLNSQFQLPGLNLLLRLI